MDKSKQKQHKSVPSRHRSATLRSAPRSQPQFDMTPMIDVVFLLIIFFMLICQFIVRENYSLNVPDDCPSSIVPDSKEQKPITVSLFPSPCDPENSSMCFAVRTRIFDPQTPAYNQKPARLIQDMAEEITQQLQTKDDTRVQLRADRKTPYIQVQKALQALAEAGVSQVQLIALPSKQNNHQPHNEQK